MNDLIAELKEYEVVLKPNKSTKYTKSSTNDIIKTDLKIRYINNLFNFYYICKYEQFDKLSLEEITKEKIRCIELVRSNPSYLRTLKISKVSFEEDLLYSKSIKLSTLKILCYYNNLSVIIIKNKCYYHFDFGRDCYLLNNNKYGHIIDIESMNLIKNKYFLLERLDNLLYAINYYKLADLKIICEKLEIPLNELKLKKQLYDSIFKKLTQMI